MNGRMPVLFIFVTAALNAIGIGLILPVMPDLIMEVRGADISNAAIWGGVLSSIFAVMQFGFSPMVGSLSDRFGRRPVLLISNGVMALDYLVMALAGTIWLLVLGRIIGGITSATHSTASAFMADISTRADKAKNFGLIGAAFGVGFVIGPAIGGFLGEYGPRAPFYAAAILAALNFAFGYFVLPETVTDETRRPFQLSRANPFSAFKYIAALPGLTALMVVYFFYQIANMVYPAVWAYYTQANFGWSPQLVGISLAIYGISIAFTQIVLIRWVIKKFGEQRVVWWGLAYNGFTLSIMGVISSGWVLLLLTPLAAFGAVVAPALQAIMSGQAADNQQGELQGVLASINSIGMIATPIVMTQVFAYFTNPDTSVFLPGAPFLLAMGIMLLGWVVFASTRPSNENAP
jgi:DHA1 family tetracycline resistance protein-like MFS transporter